MKTVGVAISAWRLPIFKRHLDAAGYSYTQHPGLTPNTLFLRVKTDRVASLQPVIETANAECKKK